MQSTVMAAIRFMDQFWDLFYEVSWGQSQESSFFLFLFFFFFSSHIHGICMILATSAKERMDLICSQHRLSCTQEHDLFIFPGMFPAYFNLLQTFQSLCLVHEFHCTICVITSQKSPFPPWSYPSPYVHLALYKCSDMLPLAASQNMQSHK